MTANLDRLKSIVGVYEWIEAPQDVVRYTTDYRRLYGGPTPIVLRPGSTPEVAATPSYRQPLSPPLPSCGSINES